MQPTAQDIEKRGYIEGPNGERYAVGSPEATNYLLSQGHLPKASVLPGAVTNGNELLDFKDIVSKAANLAKEKRNALSLEFMAPHRGTVAASDFAGVLGNLNRASDTFAQDAIKNKLEADADKNLKAEIIGGFEVLRDGAGKVVATRSLPTGSGSDSGSSSGSGGSPASGKTGPVPGAPTWEQYLEAARQTSPLSFTSPKLVKAATEELRKQYDAAYTKTTGQEAFTKTEMKKLEQAGLLNKTRQEQLDFLYKKKETTKEETEMTDEELMNFLRSPAK